MVWLDTVRLNFDLDVFKTFGNHFCFFWEKRISALKPTWKTRKLKQWKRCKILTKKARITGCLLRWPDSSRIHVNYLKQKKIGSAYIDIFDGKLDFDENSVFPPLKNQNSFLTLLQKNRIGWNEIKYVYIIEKIGCHWLPNLLLNELSKPNA